jgi:hypothetical protein
VTPKNTVIAIALLGSLGSPLLAATPPGQLHYQGVLRNASGAPLDGAYDMVFRFWSAATAGDEILRDTHQTANGQAVVVSGGLFGTALGGGTVSDGAGPGTYVSLGEVFRDHASVWLSIEVNGEPLAPRVRVLAAAYSLNAANLGGRDPAAFLDTSSASQVKTGPLALVASTGIGLDARGTVAGAYFQDTDAGAYAYAGYGASGIMGVGPTQGAIFFDADQSGMASVGYGDYGIRGVGASAGGRFESSNASAITSVAAGNVGIQALGSSAGGFFEDVDESGTTYLAYGHYGIMAAGNTAGGYFNDSNGSGRAHVGFGDHGIQAYGNFMGGYFKDADASGFARVGYSDTGIEGYGNASGGYFEDLTSSGWAQVGVSTYKVSGSGAVSFVQNHPERSDEVIVYHAPEASEVAVYTRGSARLAQGRATIPLDPTFAWVANPDLGLTATVTPRAACPSLHVVSVSTRTLIVRCDEAADGELDVDYLVWGLRIGFEELPPVQPKEREAWVPSMQEHRALYAERADLRDHNALERFKAMRAAESGPPDLERAAALISAIGVHESARGVVPRAEKEAANPGASGPGARSGSPRPVEAPSCRPADLLVYPVLPLSAPAEEGEVLSLDPNRPGFVRPSLLSADAHVVGVAPAASTEKPDGTWEGPVASSGIVLVRADAAYGPIRPGDLLTTSPTPGHVMRAVEPLAGTVLGKAFDGLESGQGPIRLVLQLR